MQIHAVLLKKVLDSASVNTENWLPNANCSRWVTMGHFDEIYTYPIRINGDFINCIKEDKDRVSSHNNESVYYHPLYVISDSCNNYSCYNEKWYCAFVRIHFASSTDLVQQFTSLSQDINKKLYNRSLDIQLFYGSEFSDMVMAVYGQDLSSLIRSILEVRQLKHIGKMYTYFGINHNKLITNEVPPTESDVLDFFSLRFHGVDISTTNAQIQAMIDAMGEQPIFCVTGIDDILIRFDQLKAFQVVDLFRKCFIGPSGDIIKNTESTIRVGIKITPPLEGGESKQDLKPLCSRLLSLLSSIDQCENKEAIYSWYGHLSQLTKSLARMSRMPVMDEVVYLLAPGIRTFLENILEMLKREETQQLRMHMDCFSRFTEHCFYLMEQLMRLEGQLSQQPEIRPVIYDMPVFILEYILAFLNEVCDVLQKADKTPNSEFDFLLIPHSCALIEALEVFPAVSGQRRGLVQIEIPTDLLYSPINVLRALCHEVSHYVGETFRHREERKDYYCTAAASTFAALVFDVRNPDFSRVIKNIFLDALQNIHELTLQEMNEQILACTDDILVDSCFDELVFKYLTTSKKPKGISKLEADSIDLGRTFFWERLEDINYLFQETYADVCMLYLLKIDEEEYISSLLQEFACNPPVSDEISYETLAVRIYSTLCASKRSIHYSHERYSKEWVIVQEIIQAIQSEIANKTDGKYGLSYSIAAINALKNYASLCYSTLSQALTAEKIQNLQNMYQSLKQPDLEYSMILEKIDSCRSKMLKK